MTNRLATQTSPYLLQHATNPVDWYPWGEEPFARARDEDKPVLLSIGYAACHWCHVMERESFEDPSTAALMNEHFVCVKVDREERPDVDSVYMGAVQALTGHGGWPMTVFCSPDGTPFLGGTYFPPEPRHGMPSFSSVLTQVDELWHTRRDELIEQGNALVDTLRRQVPAPSTEPLQAGVVTAGVAQIASTHDPVHGGFGSAPKFPQAPLLELLLRADTRRGLTRLPLERTLTRMALGGIYDQVGGGFARYSVDEAWLVPHFEKMLYDNAQLARVYTHAWQAYGDPLYRRIAEETLDYLLRDMLDEGGAFHSSEDADSEGIEGKFYVFDADEVPPDAREFYGVTPGGNFEGANILTAAGGVPPEAARTKLFELRSRRTRPAKDDKVLASWNGLAIAAFAEAGAAFGRPGFVDAARKAADFVLTEMKQGGRLLHSYRAGRAGIPGFLEDYAFLADGSFALWEATFDERFLLEARRLTEEALGSFTAPGGGFYTSGSDAEQLIVKQVEVIESATPAPGAVLSLIAQKLAVLYDAPDLATPAIDALRVAKIYMDRVPSAVPSWLAALDFYVSTPQEIAFTGPMTTAEGEALRTVITSRFLPNRVLAADANVALLAGKPQTDTATAYVCEHYVCKQPTSDPAELAALLAE